MLFHTVSTQGHLEFKMGAIFTQSMGSEYGTPVKHFHRLPSELPTLQFFVGMPAVKCQCLDAIGGPV